MQEKPPIPFTLHDGSAMRGGTRCADRTSDPAFLPNKVPAQELCFLVRPVMPVESLSDGTESDRLITQMPVEFEFGKDRKPVK